MFLGLDLGTSGVKALLMDDGQNVIGSADAPLTVNRLNPGWSEQNPEDWIEATKFAVGKLRAENAQSFPKIKGIGLSGQMHGATLLDAEDRVLCPCILWNDTRSHRQAALLDGDPEFRRLTGNIVFPGFTAPKLSWVKDEKPALFDKVATVLLPKDYLRLWLTGEKVSEMSDAAGTSWLDVENRSWSASLLQKTGLNADAMPSLVEGSHMSGKLRPALREEWGIGDVVVAGGAGDNAASAIGMGTVKGGDAFLSLGTSGVLFAANNAYAPNPESAVHTFCHAVPDTWHQMGVILSATDSLNWYSKLVGADVPTLFEALGDDLTSPTDATFLPYLSGERTPHNDAAIRGGFLGLDHSTSRETLTQSLIEGVAFAFRDNLNALADAGTQLDAVMAVGGGSRSDLWLKLLATVLELPVHRPEDGEFGAAFGAARLGMMAAEGSGIDFCEKPTIARTFEPQANLIDAYQSAYARYKRTYPALKGIEN